MSICNWSVTVERNGERLLTITNLDFCGKDLTVEDEDFIREAAKNLLAFVGEHPDDLPACGDSDIPF